jgi:hypothetical protein
MLCCPCRDEVDEHDDVVEEQDDFRCFWVGLLMAPSSGRSSMFSAGSTLSLEIRSQLEVERLPVIVGTGGDYVLKKVGKRARVISTERTEDMAIVVIVFAC